MEDKLADRYRNISGTILVINDLNYLEIGINDVIDLRLFSDDFLSKSRGIREHIALKNLVPDTSNVQAMQLSTSDLNKNKLFNDDIIKELIKETSKYFIESKLDNSLNIELIKIIAAEVGKEIANNIQPQFTTEKTIDQNNEYEQNIIDSNIEKIQQALENKYPSPPQKPSLASEESFDDNSDNYIADLKDIITGGK